MFQVKPQRPILNKGHVLTKGLIIDIPIFEHGGSGSTELVRNIKSTFAGSPTWTADNFGSGLIFNGTTDGLVSPTDRTLTTVQDNWTMEVWFKANVLTAGVEYVIAQTTGAADNAGASIEVDNQTLKFLINGIARVDTSFAPTVGKIYQVVMRRQAGVATMFVNGVPLATTTSSTPNATQVSFNLGVARQNSTTLFRFFNGVVYSGRFWERPLSQSEIFSLYTNPWQIYQKPKRFTVQSAGGDVTTTQTITGKGRIQIATSQTITGKGRIQVATSRTQTALSRIQKAISQTITGVARIRATITQTITGKARIQKSASQTQTGIARVLLAVNQTVTGLSRITAVTLRTVTGVARLTATTSQVQTGKARLQKTASQVITALGRLQKAVTQTISGKSAIQKATDRTQTGKAVIGLISLPTQLGKSRIQATQSRNQSAVGTINAGVSQTITGAARIATVAIKGSCIPFRKYIGYTDLYTPTQNTYKRKYAPQSFD